MSSCQVVCGRRRTLRLGMVPSKNCLSREVSGFSTRHNFGTQIISRTLARRGKSVVCIVCNLRPVGNDIKRVVRHVYTRKLLPRPGLSVSLKFLPLSTAPPRLVGSLHAVLAGVVQYLSAAGAGGQCLKGRTRESCAHHVTLQ